MGDEGWLFGSLIGFCVGLIFSMLIFPSEAVSAKKVATQICEFLDTDLIDYDWTYQKFDYIKCGDKKLIEGLDVEKLIEILE